MRRLLLLFISVFLFISSQASARGLNNLDNRPIIYVVHENPIAAYYGSPASSYLARALPEYQIYANYIDVDAGKAIARNGFLVNTLVAEIKRLSPKVVFVHNRSLGYSLKSHLPDTKIASVSTEDSSIYDFVVDDPIYRLVSILKETKYKYDKIYILHDTTNKSASSLEVVTNKLVELGIPKQSIVGVESKTMLQFEANVRKLNLLPQSVLLNRMFMLMNTESRHVEYLPDIKEIITRVNKKHLDVGFYRTSTGNECIVLENDYTRIREYVRRLEYTDMPSTKLKPLEVRALFNVDRLDKLRLNSFYLEGLSEMDDIVK